MLNKIGSALGVLAGLTITIISIVDYLFRANLLVRAVQKIPLAGSAILNVLYLLYEPWATVFFPLVGVFLVCWSAALAAKESWARIVGIVLYALAVVYFIAILILVVPFLDTPFIQQYRWWILGAALVVLVILGSYVWALVNPEAERAFAAQYVDQRIVDKCDRCGSLLDSRGRCPKCDVPSRAVEKGAPGERKAPPRAQPPPPTLARLKGAEDKVYEIRKPRTTIGRAEDNDIVLADMTVSGHHAEIIHQQGQFAVQDLGSTNGTFVNGTKVERSRLESGCELQLGRMQFAFEILGAA